MAKKKIATIEKLAEVTQNEFITMGRRFDTLEGKVDGGFKAVADVLDLMKADIHDIKIALGPMVRSVIALEETVKHHDKRLIRLEEKVGLTR